MKNNRHIHLLCEGALVLAAAQVLSFIKLYQLPWGGSVVLSMVPVVLFSVRWGLKGGLLVGFAFGILQLLFDGGFAISIQSIIGDYLLAFTVLGLAGIFRGKKHSWLWGSLVAGAARFLVHYVVGATVWAMYMPETFLGSVMTTPWFYSAIYNLLYMLPNTLITVIVLGLLSRPLAKYLNGENT